MIPLRLLAYVAAATALAGVYTWRVHVERDYGRAEVKALWDRERAQQQADALGRAQAAAQETRRRMDQQREAQDVYEKKIAQARDDARRAGAAAGRMREQLAATVAAAGGAGATDSAVAGQRPPAGAALDLLAELLSRADGAAGELAAYADAARAAGEQCERDYGALNQ